MKSELTDLRKNVIDPDRVCNKWVSVCNLLVPGVDALGLPKPGTRESALQFV